MFLLPECTERSWTRNIGSPEHTEGDEHSLRNYTYNCDDERKWSPFMNRLAHEMKEGNTNMLSCQF